MTSWSLGPGGFRFLLAYMVVIEHVSRFEIGKVAVMVFFILSGFWVTRVFKERYSKTSQAIPVFYLSRFLRIWPLYITVFLITALLAALFSFPTQPNTWIAIPILGVGTHHIDIIGVTWSLDIEIQFYILLPLIVFFLSKLHNAGAWVLFYGVVLLLWGVGLYLGGRFSVETVLLYLPIFLTGMTIYLFNLRSAKTSAQISVTAFCLVGVCAVFIPALKPYVIYGSGSDFDDKIFALFWSVSLLPFVAFNVRQKSSLIDRHLGNLSYTIYLVHFPMTNMSKMISDRDMTDIEKLYYLVLVLLVSLALYFLLEVQFERWRRRIVSYVQSNLCFYRAKR